jgi:gliding motility-associated-like protein
MVHFNAMGEPYALVTDPVMLRVKGVDIYGCFNNDSIAYEDIKPCCDFFYPTAFTPNGDGLNDGFRVVPYGNMYDYRLEVFNRWGQRVYLSADPHARWDGTRGGVPCDLGTYFFRFNARCLTGKVEEYHGDVTLIR